MAESDNIRPESSVSGYGSRRRYTPPPTQHPASSIYPQTPSGKSMPPHSRPLNHSQTSMKEIDLELPRSTSRSGVPSGIEEPVMEAGTHVTAWPRTSQLSTKSPRDERPRSPLEGPLNTRDHRRHSDVSDATIFPGGESLRFEQARERTQQAYSVMDDETRNFRERARNARPRADMVLEDLARAQAQGRRQDHRSNITAFPGPEAACSKQPRNNTQPNNNIHTPKAKQPHLSRSKTTIERMAKGIVQYAAAPAGPPPNYYSSKSKHNRSQTYSNNDSRSKALRPRAVDKYSDHNEQSSPAGLNNTTDKDLMKEVIARGLIDAPVETQASPQMGYAGALPETLTENLRYSDG